METLCSQVPLASNVLLVLLHKSGVIICVYASNKLPVNTVLYPIRLLTSDQMILLLYGGTNVM
jgi:hypothetical protein